MMWLRLMTGLVMVASIWKCQAKKMPSHGDFFKPAATQPVNLAAGKPVNVSSAYGGGQASVTDGSCATSWQSDKGDPQWAYVDLGSNQLIGTVNLFWATPFAPLFQLQLSSDLKTWWIVYESDDPKAPGTTTVQLSGNARYVRAYGYQSSTPMGYYALYEMQVYPPQSGYIPSYCTIEGNLAAGAPMYRQDGSIDLLGELANDGNYATEWDSTNAATPQKSLYVDLGSVQPLGQAEVYWGTSGSTGFEIQVSNDTGSWAMVFADKNRPGDVNVAQLSISAQYVKVFGYQSGFSLREVLLFSP